MNYDGLGGTAGARVPQQESAVTADPQPSGNVVEAGDFRLDVSRRTASVHGRELNLTATEFDVLLFLTNHPANVVTTSTTLMTSWKGRQVKKVEFLHTLLSLRRKLASSDGANAYLSTESLILCRFNANGLKRP